jgi:hypothetical protein
MSAAWGVETPSSTPNGDILQPSRSALSPFPPWRTALRRVPKGTLLQLVARSHSRSASPNWTRCRCRRAVAGRIWQLETQAGQVSGSSVGREQDAHKAEVDVGRDRVYGSKDPCGNCVAARKDKIGHLRAVG